MSNKQKNLTIVGQGAWGRVLGNLATRNNHKVRVWSRSSESSLNSLIKDVEVILSAVSMKGVRPTIERLQTQNISPETIIVSATKGLDPISTLTPTQIWQNAFPHHAVVVLSGPNLSKEIARGLPAATVVASKNLQAAEVVQQLFASEVFRVYVNNDPIGTELGGVLKNVMAIAAGVCDGLQLGTNAKSALLTRALPEMIRVGNHLGAATETFFGLSGLGDLLATCGSSLSRNYQVGFGLAQGKSLEQILSEIEGTAEGVNTVNVLMELANREKIAVPISLEVFKLINGKITPQEAVKALMARQLKEEFSDLVF
jgi:glycerol-3-phosphate dehydrogenase (NAD(P)+)